MPIEHVLLGAALLLLGMAAGLIFGMAFAWRDEERFLYARGSSYQRLPMTLFGRRFVILPESDYQDLFARAGYAKRAGEVSPTGPSH